MDSVTNDPRDCESAEDTKTSAPARTIAEILDLNDPAVQRLCTALIAALRGMPEADAQTEAPE